MTGPAEAIAAIPATKVQTEVDGSGQSTSPDDQAVAVVPQTAPPNAAAATAGAGQAVHVQAQAQPHPAAPVSGMDFVWDQVFGSGSYAKPAAPARPAAPPAGAKSQGTQHAATCPPGQAKKDKC